MRMLLNFGMTFMLILPSKFKFLPIQNLAVYCEANRN